jgi:hypothetical protein
VFVGVLVGVLVGVFVGAFVGVFVAVFVGVVVGVFVAVFVGVRVGVLVGVLVAVFVAVFVGVLEGVGVQMACAPQVMSACDDEMTTSVPPGPITCSALTVITHEPLPLPELVCSLMITTTPLSSVMV